VETKKKLPTGRSYLLATEDGPSASEPPLSKLAVFTEHPNTIRRGGIATTIKCVCSALYRAPVANGTDPLPPPQKKRNCCFVKEAHKAILVENGINVLPRILLPLCGSEEFDLEVRGFAVSRD
jgi:hypothetical protein